MPPFGGSDRACEQASERASERASGERLQSPAGLSTRSAQVPPFGGSLLGRHKCRRSAAATGHASRRASKRASGQAGERLRITHERAARAAATKAKPGTPSGPSGSSATPGTALVHLAVSNEGRWGSELPATPTRLGDANNNSPLRGTIFPGFGSDIPKSRNSSGSRNPKTRKSRDRGIRRDARETIRGGERRIKCTMFNRRGGAPREPRTARGMRAPGSRGAASTLPYISHTWAALRGARAHPRGGKQELHIPDQRGWRASGPGRRACERRGQRTNVRANGRASGGRRRRRRHGGCGGGHGHGSHGGHSSHAVSTLRPRRAAAAAGSTVSGGGRVDGCGGQYGRLRSGTPVAHRAHQVKPREPREPREPRDSNSGLLALRAAAMTTGLM